MRRMLLVCLALTLISVVVTAADRFVPPPTTQLYGRMIPYPIQPPSIAYPEYTKPSTEKQYTVTLINSFDSLCLVQAVGLHEDSAKPSAPGDWLGINGAPTEIPAHDSRSMTLRLNKGGVVTSLNPTTLYGKVTFTLQLTGDPEPVIFTLPIQFTVADTVVFPIWDTIITQCGIPLAVGTNGNLGAHGIGGANLNFPQPSPECDTGGSNPGNADIYLADASPIVVRRRAPGDYVGSWSVYDGDVTSPNGFKPLFPTGNRGYFSAARWQGFNTGTFCTVDSLVKIERTYWAPYGAINADSCHFVIIRTRYFPYSIGMSVTNLAIGDAFDWDVPTDSGTSSNIAGTDPTRRLVYMRGFNSQDSEVDCYDNSLRYGGAALFWMYSNHSTVETNPYAGYNAANDSFVYPAGGFVPEQLWTNMQPTGYSNEARVTDLHSVLVYKNGSADVGYTLRAFDTLTVLTAIAVVRPSGGTTEQGLDSLKKEIDKAFKWSSNIVPSPSPCGCCCLGPWRGNVNMSANDTPDLSDLSLMIAYLTQDPRPPLGNFAEADVNVDCRVDLSDLSCLISYLTNPGSTCIQPC